MLIHGRCAVEVGIRRCNSHTQMGSINSDTRFECLPVVKTTNIDVLVNPFGRSVLYFCGHKLEMCIGKLGLRKMKFNQNNEKLSD